MSKINSGMSPVSYKASDLMPVETAGTEILKKEPSSELRQRALGLRLRNLLSLEKPKAENVLSNSYPQVHRALTATISNPDTVDQKVVDNLDKLLPQGIPLLAAQAKSSQTIEQGDEEDGRVTLLNQTVSGEANLINSGDVSTLLLVGGYNLERITRQGKRKQVVEQTTAGVTIQASNTTNNMEGEPNVQAVLGVSHKSGKIGGALQVQAPLVPEQRGIDVVRGEVQAGKTTFAVQYNPKNPTDKRVSASLSHQEPIKNGQLSIEVQKNPDEWRVQGTVNVKFD